MAEKTEDVQCDWRPETGHTFILPSRVLDMLGGSLTPVVGSPSGQHMVDKGAYLWGVDNLDLPKPKEVFEHSCRVGRGVWRLGMALTRRSAALGDGRYNDLNPGVAAEAGAIHDALKMHSGADAPTAPIIGRENLTSAQKEYEGLPPGYREISDEADLVLVEWLTAGGFPQEVIDTVVGHDFPTSEKAVHTPYQQLVMWADYCCANKFTGTEERLRDVFDRWILRFVVNRDDFAAELDSVALVRNHWQELRFADGKPPRIEAERAAKAADIIIQNRDNLFGYLGISEKGFIEQSGLNDDLKMPPWERVLRKARDKDVAFQAEGGKGAPRASHVTEVVRRKTG